MVVSGTDGVLDEAPYGRPTSFLSHPRHVAIYPDAYSVRSGRSE